MAQALRGRAAFLAPGGGPFLSQETNPPNVGQDRSSLECFPDISSSDSRKPTLLTPSFSRGRPRRPSLSNDIVFKALFSGHPHLLADLIDAIRQPAIPTAGLHILPPDLLPDAPRDKLALVDIRAQDAEGRQYIIEMQRFGQRHWPARNLYYLAHALATQLRRGTDYDILRPVIGISLMGRNLYPRWSDQSDWRFTLRDAGRPVLEFSDSLQLYVVELDKPESLAASPPALKAWASCLRDSQDEALMNALTHPPVIEALRILDEMSLKDENFRWQLLARDIEEFDHNTRMKHAREDGHEAGLAEGRSEGRAQGQAAMLELMIAHRFGAVTDTIRARLGAADARQIESWGLNVLEASTLEDVFR